MQTFAQSLKRIRTSKNVTQAELARRLGRDVMAISKLETGRREDPRWSTVCAIADALGVGVEDFRKSSKKTS
jgi:transcriptional regulator with XRE-family HTH domain